MFIPGIDGKQPYLERPAQRTTGWLKFEMSKLSEFELLELTLHESVSCTRFLVRTKKIAVLHFWISICKLVAKFLRS